MRNLRTYTLEGIVIRRRNIGEKDRILSLFTDEEGKIDVISKGCRRPGSRLCSFSDIGMIARFGLHKAKFLPIVSEAMPIYIPDGAQGHFNKTERLGYMFKVADKLFHEAEPHKKTYNILKQAVETISDGDFQLVFLCFLSSVIEDLGLQPELYSCSICSKEINSTSKIKFSHKGGIAHQDCSATDCEEVTTDDIKLLRIIFEKPFDQISKSKVSDHVFKKVYGIVKSYIEWHFGDILPQKIL